MDDWRLEDVSNCLFFVLCRERESVCVCVCVLCVYGMVWYGMTMLGVYYDTNVGGILDGKMVVALANKRVRC